MPRYFICTLLLASASFGQDLKIERFSIDRWVSNPGIFQQNNQNVPRIPAADPGPSNKTVQGKSHKKLWITVAVVAGTALTGLVLVDKRLKNEGGGVFR